jgi:hypothetical protein
MTVIGQFRDADRPDHIIWLRGFPNMTRRHAALEAFYGPGVVSERRGGQFRTGEVVDALAYAKTQPRTAMG